jgi:hypothetical protein
MFEENCIKEYQVSTMVILKFTVDGFEDKYLGLSMPEGRMKVGKCKSTKDKALKGSQTGLKNMLTVEGRKL